MSVIIEAIRRELSGNIDEHTRETGQRFFKESIKSYGVKTAVVGRIGKKYFKNIQDEGKKEIFGCCEKLWQSGYLEESFIACNWSYYIRREYRPEDMAVFEQWIEHYVSNWASCDTLCNHSVGAFIEMYPDYLSVLKKWTTSNNRWMRRAAAVSLIIPAKNGRFFKDVLEIADLLLLDRDDLVQKGYGWMLKEASRKNQKEVFDYVFKNKKIMPRTALRYAIEKMPKELKVEAMARQQH
jgi:3-methyladenine DNA glycosylase AlkD